MQNVYGGLAFCYIACIDPLKQKVPDASIFNFTFINLIISGDDFTPKFTSQAEIIFIFVFRKIYPCTKRDFS
jgi:hypothetical protein